MYHELFSSSFGYDANLVVRMLVIRQAGTGIIHNTKYLLGEYFNEKFQ
jgi:hypothetical protein